MGEPKEDFKKDDTGDTEDAPAKEAEEDLKKDGAAAGAAAEGEAKDEL